MRTNINAGALLQSTQVTQGNGRCPPQTPNLPDQVKSNAVQVNADQGTNQSKMPFTIEDLERLMAGD